MSFERDIDKTAKNIRDGVDEIGHRANADAEQTKRDVAGDAMTPGEKAKSMTNQAKNEVQADVDRAKRDIRSNT